MKDYRTLTSNIEKISMDINVSNITQLLMSIGINPTTQVVNGVVNYLISNKLELTISNLLKSLKANSLIKSNDYRTITCNNKIHILNYPIRDIGDFDFKMHQLGYTNFTDDFLIKKIDDVTINISRNFEQVQAITCYDKNNSVIEIPDEILQIVIDDIEESNEEQ